MTSEAGSVHVSLTRGIAVDISDGNGHSIFNGDMPQVPAVGERVWLNSDPRTFVVRGVEWNILRDGAIGADLTVEAVET